MLTFLAPFALIGASLLSIPIILHLLKPRKVRQTPFSSLRWLRMTQQRLSRKIQWHQILLFIFRALLVSFMVFALAKPVLSLRGGHRFSERFIVFDVSRSMSYKIPDRPTPFDQGKKIAQDLLIQNLVGDRTTILLTGNSTAALGPLITDAEKYLPKLEAVPPGLSDTDLTSALQVIRPMLSRKRPNTSVEIFFITDNHQQSWSQGGIASFLDGLGLTVSTHLIELGLTAPKNAWIANARLIETASPTKRAIRIQMNCVGDEPLERTVRVSKLTGLGDLTAKVTLQPGQPVETEIPLPDQYDVKGKIAQILIEPQDVLPSDDQFWLNLDARGLVRVLLLEPPDTTQIETAQPGFHLRTALEALDFAQSGTLQLGRKSSEAVSSQEIAEADIIIMANVPKLSDPTLLALENRVKAGAGLVVFLGPSIQIPFYNTKFFNPTHPSESLFPAPILNQVQADQNSHQLARLTRVQWMHPLLSPLFDPTFGDLAQVRFHSYCQLGEMPPGSASQVLAWIDDVHPAILERSLGAGKVVIFNATANDEWSDLPRRKSFVPLLDQLVSHLARGVVRRVFQVGDSVDIPLSTAKSDATVSVTTPSGQKVTPSLRKLNAQTIVRLDSVKEIGVYTIQQAGTDPASALTFVVQAGRGDSVLTHTDAETLKSWWEPAAFEVIHPDPNSKGAGLPSRGRVLLWPWFMALASLMFLAEMYFVHRLCPHVNPKIVTSQVPQHGIVAPTMPMATPAPMPAEPTR